MGEAEQHIPVGASAPPGLVDGWLGTAEQRRAVEKMFRVKIASDSAERGMWSKNFWSPYVSTAETHHPNRVLMEIVRFDATPAATNCLVWTPCLPSYQLGLLGVTGATLEFYDHFYLEHYHDSRSTSLDSARNRKMPSSAVWQVVGYVSPDIRIVRQCIGDAGRDVDGLPKDVRNCPVNAGGLNVLKCFCLVRGVSAVNDKVAYSITLWGNLSTIIVTERVARGEETRPTGGASSAPLTLAAVNVGGLKR